MVPQKNIFFRLLIYNVPKIATFMILDGCFHPCSLINVSKVYSKVNNKSIKIT